MIRSVTVTNHNHESLTLDLYHPEYSGMIVTNIEGLGPANANINVTDMATVDGGIFSSARQTTRNIVIHLRFMMEPTIEDVRLKTYKYFPIKKKIQLRFKTDRRTSEISGYVESNTPDIFSQEESCQISIICTDPNFYASGDTGTVFSGVNPKFESPIFNDRDDPSSGTTDDSPYPKVFNYLHYDLAPGEGWPADIWASGDPNVMDEFEFGEISFETTAIFTYYGDADTGMLITIHALGQAENITLWNNETREHITVDTNKIYQITGIRYDSLDDILINTTRGERYVRLLHEGKYYDILASVNRDADFFQLTNGVNVFSFQADSGEENLIVTFSYKNAYGGI